MDLHLSTQPVLDWAGDCLAIGVTESDLPLAGVLADLDEKLSGLVQELIDEAEFKAAADSSAVIRVGKAGPVRKLMLVGLGKAAATTLETLRRAGAIAARTAKKRKVQSLGYQSARVE